MNNKLIGNEYDNTKVEVRLIDEDAWLNVETISNLFGVQRPAIIKQISNIYHNEELEINPTCSKMEHIQLEIEKWNVLTPTCAKNA